jgi:hypothetical protein
MAISFVGAQGNTGTTVTIPAHQSGDLILLFAYKDGSATSITTPTAGGTVPTWISINFGGGSFNSTNFRYAVATGSNTTSGTWTTATEIFCLVYRGTKAIGATAAANNTTNVITYPALTLNRTDSTSWIVGVAGHRSATDVEQAPSGMTNRVSSGTEAAGHDTNGTVSSWSAQTVTVNASSGWRSVTVELRDASLSLSCEAGSYALSGQNATLTKGAAANSYTLPSAAGSCVLTGQVADLRTARQVAGAAGGFNVIGQTAGFAATRLLGGGVGAFTAIGQSAALQGQRYLSGAAGAVAVTGQIATLSESIPTALTLNAAAGGYVGTGQPVSLRRAVLLPSAAGSLVVTGSHAELIRQRLPFNAAAGALIVVGQAAGFGYERKLAGDSTGFALTGHQATCKTQRLLTSASAGFLVTAQAANLNKSNRRRVLIFI